MPQTIAIRGLRGVFSSKPLAQIQYIYHIPSLLPILNAYQPSSAMTKKRTLIPKKESIHIKPIVPIISENRLYCGMGLFHKKRQIM